MENTIIFDGDTSVQAKADSPMRRAYGAAVQALHNHAMAGSSVEYTAETGVIRTARDDRTAAVIMEDLRGVFASEGIGGIQMSVGPCVSQGASGPAVPQELFVAEAIPAEQ